MSRSALGLVTAAAMLVVACTQAVPGATPTGQPTDAPTTAPTATATATSAATGTPLTTSSPDGSASPRPTPCDEYEHDCSDVGGSPTASPPQGSMTVTAITYGELGTYLAGPTQMALYTFDNDSPGSSTCTGNCADTWPPLTVAMGETPAAAPGVSGELGTIVRDDLTHQVTYNGAPLYYFVGDTQVYDVGGDGLNGVWHLARP